MTLALVVDDHPEGSYLLRCLLEAEGFQVLEARNGQEALQATQGKAVDLVVSDILMPVMDGFSLCRAWRADGRLRSVPFVFYTATYVDKRDEDFAMSLGADLFLVKPTEPAELMVRLREVLARQSPATVPANPAPAAELPFLQQYSAVLIHKLEDKLEELEKANQSLRLKDFALASSTNGILFTRPNGDVTYANPAILRMAGKALEDVIEKPVGALFATRTAFERWLVGDGDNNREGPPEMQLAMAPSASTATWLRVEKHAISDDAGCPLGLMFSCSDVTEERTLRQELARVQRLESLSLFAAGIAHDFNNLLMGIFAALELETLVQLSDHDRNENRAVARAAFERARGLTRRLLTFAKGGPSERHPTDLRHLLDESVSLSLSGSAIQCQKHYCQGPALAVVDPGQLAQVFSNLLVNARQAMNDEGELSVSVSLGESPPQTGESSVPIVKVSIADRGPGIAPEILHKIFEPYFTTKKQGTGLGLATSHAILVEHGGQISVTSRPGAGATFEVWVPAARGDAGASGRDSVIPIAHRPARILVMDDDVPIRSLLKRGLERVGYTVVVAGNGEQAILEFQRARDAGQPFDLVVLDITVRGGMGGVETLGELRQLDPAVPAIAATGYLGENASPDLQARGFAGVIAKPFLLHELCATIKAVLP